MLSHVLGVIMPYRHFILIIVTLSALFGAYFFGRNDGKAIESAKCNTQKQEAIYENIEVRKEQDQVIRADTAAYINSLQSGAF